MNNQNSNIPQNIIDGMLNIFSNISECTPDGYFFQKMKGKAKTDFIHPKKLKPAKLGIYEDCGSYHFIDEEYDIRNKTVMLVNDPDGYDYEFNIRIWFICDNDLYYKWIEETFHVPSKQYILKIKIKSDVLLALSDLFNNGDEMLIEDFWKSFEWNFILDEIQDNPTSRKELLEDFMDEISEYTDVTVDDFLNRPITKQDFK
jgi:hypothetical protein